MGFSAFLAGAQVDPAIAGFDAFITYIGRSHMHRLESRLQV
jgi:hypothetical protein